MAKSKSLEIVLFNSENGKEMICQFESESPQRNLLMSVQMEGYSLDTFDLRNDHPKVYCQISNAMRNKAEQFWDAAKKREVADVS